MWITFKEETMSSVLVSSERKVPRGSAGVGPGTAGVPFTATRQFSSRCLPPPEAFQTPSARRELTANGCDGDSSELLMGVGTPARQHGRRARVNSRSQGEFSHTYVATRTQTHPGVAICVGTPWLELANPSPEANLKHSFDLSRKTGKCK